MVRKGYLQQQIEALAAVVARLAGLKADAENSVAADMETALSDARKGAREITGLDIDALVALPQATALHLLTTNGGHLDAGRAVVVAVLMAEQADLLAADGDNDHRDAIQVRRDLAGILLSRALVQEPTLRTEEFKARTRSLLGKT